MFGIELAADLLDLKRPSHTCPTDKASQSWIGGWGEGISLVLTCCHLLSLVLTCSRFFSLVLTCSHLLSLDLNCSHLFSLVLICSHLISLVLTCSHLLSLVLTCPRLFSLVITCSHLVCQHLVGHCCLHDERPVRRSHVLDGTI